MPEKVVPGPVCEDRSIREAVCIHTKKIFDSCKDKDCIEDLRVYPTRSSQEVIDRALSVKAGTAELLYAYIDVEPVTFNRGFYTWMCGTSTASPLTPSWEPPARWRSPAWPSLTSGSSSSAARERQGVLLPGPGEGP